MQKLVDMARRTLDIDQKAADAARHDNPQDAERLARRHRIGDLRALHRAGATSAGKAAKRAWPGCSSIARRRRRRSTSQQTRDSFARPADPRRAESREARDQTTRRRCIRPRRTRRARVKHLRWFQQKHGLALPGRVVSDNRQFYHFAIVAALALVEWISLAAFYAEGSDFGLLGGVLIAMTLSIVNVSLAILSGSLLAVRQSPKPAPEGVSR